MGAFGMSSLEKIQTFLRSVTAVSQTHYQFWDANGRQIFSTQAQQPDVLTMSSHLRMAKKIILDGAFRYSPVDRDGFLCGIPMELDDTTTGALLATGICPAQYSNNGHDRRMNSFLLQIQEFGKNGRNGHTASHEIPGPGTSSMDDFFLFANLSKQFRSLRIKQPVLGKLLRRMFESMAADAVFLTLPEKPQYNLLEIRPAHLENGDAKKKKDALEQLITGGIKLCSGYYCIVNDSRENADFDGLSDRPYRLLAVAVRHLKKSYGWLGIVSYATGMECESELLVLMQTLANQLAAMLANMDQQDDLEHFTVNMVCSLVNAIEAKDAYTKGHSKRVHRYSMLMARQLKLPSHETQALRWASVLHDIGKIGIPERILAKPGKLTEKEFSLIKEHPVKGKTILAPIRQLASSLQAIAHHHERFDGDGYPDGLMAEQIPLAARIITVADTFDALTSKRSYHASKTPAAALNVLEQVAGTQLDPHLVKVFKTVYQQIQMDEANMIPGGIRD
jgi:HD-GYP domain-containing protein (c-di-GMP phosphodiesterase class II)